MDNSHYPPLENGPQRRRGGVPTAVWAAIIAFLLCLTTVFFFLWQITLHRSTAYADMKKINDVLQIFDRYSLYDTPSEEELTDAMLRAALAAYGDRYAAYYTKDEFAAWQQNLSGDFCGIGVLTLWEEDAGLLLLDVFPGSPAEAAGLVPGDRIVAVDGRSVTALGQTATMEAIAGEEGTSLRLTVQKTGPAGSVAVTLTRAKVVQRSVLSRVLSGETTLGYVRITDFNEHTYEQFKAAVTDLEQQGVAGMIFDLRDNGGGTLLSVSQMLAFLLPDGDLCYVDYASASQEDYTIRSQGNTLYFDGSTETDEDFRHVLSLPMSVLINENTASAAELFSAALRDYAAQGHCSVRLVGQSSFGKGTMQITYPLPDGSGFKLTVARYNPPCGTNYDGIGLTPHLPVEHTDAETPLYLLPYQRDAQLQQAAAELWQRLRTQS